MSARLQIHFHGPVTETGALSVSAIGPALVRLARAVKVTASQIHTLAEGVGYGERGGRIAKAATFIDLQISSVTPASSVDVAFNCVALPDPSNPQTVLAMQTLPELTVQRLVADIANEAAGRRCNAAARRYLKSLPAGLSQRYAAFDSVGNQLGTAEVAEATEAKASRQRPGIALVVGFLSEVGLESGKEFVTLRTVQGRHPRMRATYEQVRGAMALCDGEIRAVVRRDGKETRILRIDAASTDVAQTPEARWQHTATRWDAVLERLAK